MAKRYSRLSELVHLQRPRQIMEVGTWNGDRAIELMTAGLAVRTSVHYVGFDLFELSTPETDKREFNVKSSLSLSKVQAKLEAFINCYPRLSYSPTFELVPGDTRETLTDIKSPFPWDDTLVFIDGGHSVETIRNDFQAMRRAAVVVFDDYYTPDPQMRAPDLDKFGCNAVVNELGGFYPFPEKDPIAGGGIVQMVVWRRRP